ncbi:hypothetical protein G7054_g6717 [Neopestalotiopsis clavispora]|nr:hypothetical protein G7054_g6717 [Neopestalotiopsis clavispora]
MATPTLSDSVEAHVDSEERVDSADESGNIFDATISGEIPGPAENKASSPVMKGISDATLDDVQDPRKASGETNTSPLALQSTDSQKAQLDGRLIDAASKGDLGALKKTIEEGANITFKGPGSETALHRACRSGHRHIVEELLNHEETLKCLGEEDCDGWTPLISACSTDYLGTKRIVELLLQHQQNDHFNIEATSDEGKTALHTACWESSKEVVELLLKNNALVDATDDHNCTPLTLACERPSPEIVQLLLENKAGCDAADNDGDTPLILACERGTTDMVAKILEYNPKSMSSRNNLGRGALGSAILNADARDQIIPLLLNKGLEVDRKDASEIFPRVISDKVSGSHVEQSAWLKVIQEMMKSNNPNVDKPLTEAIKPILQFASKEEKVFAILNADNKEHFDILSGLTEELGLSKDICSLIWLSGRDDVEATMFGPHVEALFKEMQSLRSGQVMSRLIPESRLQWAAYYGDYTLVWYILKQSETDNQEDVNKAMDIVKARQPTRRSKGKKGTVSSEGEKEEKMVSKQLDRVEDTEKQKDDRHPKRYEYTMNILANATSLVSIPKKQIKRPGPSDIEGKEALLQKSTATIVSLYERDGQFDLLRSTPSVYDLVYAIDGEGVKAVMEMARSTFDGMTNTTLDKQAPRKDLKLRWIHLPANTMDWMEDKERSEDEKYLTSFMDLAQRSQNELPTDKSDIKFMKPICLRESNGLTTKEESQDSDETSQQDVAVGARRLALYTPYVTFGHCYPAGEKASNPKNAVLREQYKGRILHGPRSLDRFYYNALTPNEMDKRDISQVVTRRLLNLEMGDPLPKEGQEWPYLTVDQLWVWVIDNGKPSCTAAALRRPKSLAEIFVCPETIISSSTHREDNFDTLLFDEVWKNLLQASQTGFGENSPTTVTAMSQFLVSTCVGFINNLTWKGVCKEKEDQNDDGRLAEDRSKRDASSKSILMLYADSINEVATKEKDLFNAFKDRMAQAQSDSSKAVKEARAKIAATEKKAHMKGKEGTHRQDIANDELDLKISLQSLEKDEKDWEAINKAAKLLDEVKDIREELVILKFLVVQQECVWSDLVGPNPDSHDARSPSFTANELDAMIQMTETIQKSIKNLLSLEENSIDIKESMMSRDLVDKSARQGEILVKLRQRAQDQSEENARQEKVLFIFTFVTVLFTPLSFVTSLLALNTSTSRHNDDGELEYETGWMYRIIFGPTAGFFGLVLLYVTYAFFENIKKRFKWLKNKLRKGLRDDGRPDSRRNGDIEKCQPPRNSIADSPSVLQPKEEAD